MTALPQTACFSEVLLQRMRGLQPEMITAAPSEATLPSGLPFFGAALLLLRPGCLIIPYKLFLLYICTVDTCEELLYLS